MPWLYIAIPIVVLLGGWSIRRGLVGRRVGQHSVCGQCGYDLRGRSSQTQACPECGIDLALPRAVKTGDRARRWRSIVSGCILCSVGIALSWLAISKALRNIEIVHYEPVWWLCRSLKAADTTTHDKALAELILRATAGRLSSEQLAPLMRDALAMQADHSKPWNTAWGDLVEAAHSAGKLPDETWKQYVGQAYYYAFTTRKVIRRGDPLGWMIAPQPPRFGSNPPTFWAMQSSTMQSPDLPGPHSFESGWLNQDSPLPFGWQTMRAIVPTELAQLSDGVHVLTITQKVQVFLSPDANGPAISESTSKLQASFKLISDGGTTVTPIVDEKLRTRVQQSIGVRTGTRYRDGDQGPFVNVVISVNHPPINLAFMVFRRCNGEESQVGPLIRKQGDSNGEMFPCKVGDATTFDIVLKPDPQGAERSVDLTNYWNEEIVFPVTIRP